MAGVALLTLPLSSLIKSFFDTNVQLKINKPFSMLLTVLNPIFSNIEKSIFICTIFSPYEQILELFCVYFYWDGTIKIRQLLIDTLSLFFEDRNNEFFEQIPFWLMDSYKQIQKPENFVKGIDRMIELSGKSPEHLSRSLKKYYNISPSQLISNLKLKYALNLLMNTNMKIIDICFEAGFVNLSTFYDSFKKQYDTTPREFRKKYKKTLLKNTAQSGVLLLYGVFFLLLSKYIGGMSLF